MTRTHPLPDALSEATSDDLFDGTPAIERRPR
jgi:hypothetical protein